jgi:flagellar FliJ protein
MASTSSSALNMLLDLASEEAELAAKDLAAANKALKEEQEKNTMLDSYKQSYVAHLNMQLATGLGKETHLNYQQFLQNLQQAIDGQADAIIAAEYERDNKREVLQTGQRKKMSYEVLIKRAKKKAMQIENKRDQKMMDEFAMRAKRRG